MGSLHIKQSLYYFLPIFVSLLIALSMGVGVEEGQIFCYPGTYCWRAKHPIERNLRYPDWPSLCYQGAYQSPIDIPLVKKPTGRSGLRVDMNSYDHKRYFLWNTGRTVLMRATDYVPPTSTPSPDKNEPIMNIEHGNSTRKKRSAEIEERIGRKPMYKFVEAHFHWSENNSYGSEHTINGTHFSLEMHMTHYNSKYESFSDAAASKDHSALLVVARLFQADDSNPDNPLFYEINDNFPMEYELKPKTVIQVDISKFLPKKGDTFYRYFGGLTTPDCFEIVQWAVFDQPILISTSDMTKFRNSTDVYERHYRNFRETQHGNVRSIWYDVLGDLFGIVFN